MFIFLVIVIPLRPQNFSNTINDQNEVIKVKLYLDRV